MEKQVHSLKTWSMICGILYVLAGVVFALVGLGAVFIGAIPGVMLLFIGIFYLLIAWRSIQFKKSPSTDKVADILRFVKYTIIIQMTSIVLFVGGVVYTIIYLKNKLQQAVESLGVSEDVFDLLIDVVKQFL